MVILKMLIGVHSGRRRINFPPLLSRLWGDLAETDKRAVGAASKDRARRRPFMDLAGRRGQGERLSVPDSFLARGCGTAGQEGCLGQNGSAVPPTRVLWCLRTGFRGGWGCGGLTPAWVLP